MEKWAFVSLICGKQTHRAFFANIIPYPDPYRSFDSTIFAIENVQKNSYTVSTMSDTARNLITNWESEK